RARATMGDDTWTNPGGAQVVLVRVRLEPQAQALLTAAHSPAEFVALLTSAGHTADAAHFAAFTLPRRLAVWWACLCVRVALPAHAPPAAMNALRAAERWVVQPGEDRRRAALAAAEEAEFGTAAGCCAAAAFWSGGSIAPPQSPIVPPPEHLLPSAVA